MIGGSRAIKVILAATALASLGAAPAPARTPAPAPTAPATQARPNILFILIDDMGYGDLSITGNRLVATPNIDKLARDGLLMTQFYDPAPICSASRAGFLTGEFPAQYRFVTYLASRQRNAASGQVNWLDPEMPNLAESLKKIGYATGHFGKWHLGGGRDVGDAPLPQAYGFDKSYVQFEGLGPRVVPTDEERGLAEQSITLGQGPVDQLPKSQMMARFVDKTIGFITRNKGRPWFVDLWPDDVHFDWVPTPEQLAAVKGKGRNEEETRFLAVLVKMDKQVGRLVDALRATGQLDNTIIILTSDNGPTARHKKGQPASGSSGGYRGRKGSLYEGGIRQPLIVRWPGHVPAGETDSTTVAQGIDLYPTLAAITGAPTPAHLDGVSLVQAWEGTPIAHRPDLFWDFAAVGPDKQTRLLGVPHDRSPVFAIRSGDWKLLANRDGGDAELYDIVTDPSESHDMAAQKPAIAKALTARLVAWCKTLPLTPLPAPKSAGQ